MRIKRLQYYRDEIEVQLETTKSIV